MGIPTALIMVLVLVILIISIEYAPGKKFSTYDALCLTCCEQGPQSCYAFNICFKDYNCSQLNWNSGQKINKCEISTSESFFMSKGDETELVLRGMPLLNDDKLYKCHLWDYNVKSRIRQQN